MTHDPGLAEASLTIIEAPRQLQRIGLAMIPSLFAEAGPKGAERFIEFFTANIRNKNTRAAYARAVGHFGSWCEDRGLHLATLGPVAIAAYIEELGASKSKPTVKQHLAAIRMLFDWLVIGQVVASNPATSVRGPKHVVHKGRTPVLSAEDASLLLDATDHYLPKRGSKVGTKTPKTDEEMKLADLRDRALIAVMVYQLARVGAVVSLNAEDYYHSGTGERWWFRFHEKGGKRNDLPAHHRAQEYVHAYLLRVGVMDKEGTITADKKQPLFSSIDRHGQSTRRRLHRNDVLAMVKRRARQAGLSPAVCCHTFRATGITVYLDNGGTLENAQRMAGHSSPRTTKLYDRTGDTVSLGEVERIHIR